MPEVIFDGACQNKQEELAELDLLSSSQLPVKSPREVKTKTGTPGKTTEI